MLKQTITNLNFPDRYKNVIDTIDLERANDFVKAIINTIIAKYGIETVHLEIIRDSSNSPVSNHLTHIIEVGGLKIISDNNLCISNRSEFQNIICSVVFILNCSLAIELSKLKLYDGNLTNYYGHNSITQLIQRLANHAMIGLSYKNGFEYYANVMVFDHLINKLT